MFENFKSFDIETQSEPHVSIHCIRGGSGPALLLLHGFPQTHHIWHVIAPQLVQHFTIVAIDICGYGASSKPSGVEHYVKSAMARDCVKVMEALNLDSYFVCAHDRGARVAHKLLVDYPERIKKAIFLDICPTLAMYSQTNQEFATAYFHWFFLIQKSPFPEQVILQNARGFAGAFMGGRYGGLEKFDKRALEEYMKVMEEPDAIHAMCEDYRAAATLDLDEARDDIKETRLIKTPLKVLWGKHGVIEKCFDALKEWKEVAEKDVPIDGHGVDCGHYIPEEAPEELTKEVLEFFKAK